MLARRRGRWANIEPTLGQRLALAGTVLTNTDLQIIIILQTIVTFF